MTERGHEGGFWAAGNVLFLDLGAGCMGIFIIHYGIVHFNYFMNFSLVMYISKKF